jgi:hypothetical protein
MEGVETFVGKFLYFPTTVRLKEKFHNFFEGKFGGVIIYRAVDMDVEKLVLAVQKELHLYDPKMSGYSDKLLRENTWKRIGFETNMTVSHKNMYFL